MNDASNDAVNIIADDITINIMTRDVTADVTRDVTSDLTSDGGIHTSSIFDILIANILPIIIILGLIWLLTFLIRKMLNNIAERYTGKRIYVKTLIPIINILITLSGLLYIVFGVLKISGNRIIALGVSAGIAIGFGGQDLFANTFAGLIIIFTRPFHIGDKISVEGHYGEVIDINLLKIKIVTPDDSVVGLPTRMFLSNFVSNANSGELNCQVVTSMLIPGNINLEEIKQIAREAVYCSPFTYLKKPITIIFNDQYKETSLIQLKIKAYVYDHRHEFRFSSDIYQRIKRYFRVNNIVSPEFYRLP